MTRHMVEGATAELLSGVAGLYSSGHDLRQFLHDLLEYQRELLLQKLSPAQQELPAWATAVRPALLLKLLATLAEGEARLRSSLQPRLTLELALLAACGVPEDGGRKPEDRGQEIKHVGSDVHIAPQPKPVGNEGESLGQIESGKRKKKGEKKADVVVAEAPPPVEEGDLARLQELWPAIMQAVNRASNSMGAFLAEAEPVSVQQNKLTLRFGAPYALFMDNICKKGPARKLVEEQINALFGRKLSLEGTLAQTKEEAPAPPPEAEQVSLF
jgi:DNA polymerase III gamma/tau subunit